MDLEGIPDWNKLTFSLNKISTVDLLVLRHTAMVNIWLFPTTLYLLFLVLEGFTEYWEIRNFWNFSHACLLCADDSHRVEAILYRPACSPPFSGWDSTSKSRWNTPSKYTNSYFLRPTTRSINRNWRLYNLTYFYKNVSLTFPLHWGYKTYNSRIQNIIYFLFIYF